MLDLSDIVNDPDMLPPEPFTILRSTGLFVLGGFQSTTQSIPQVGPVQAATDEEINMLPEADVVGEVKSFWCTVPIFVTRGKAPTPGTHNETPQGTIPGTVYTLSMVPPTDNGSLFRNGLFQRLVFDYTISGLMLTLTVPTAVGDALIFSWPVTAKAAQSAADILVYGSEQYRALSVKHYPGSGFWKALGTRISAA